MRNVWFMIEGIAEDGPYTNVMTYNERQANTDTREGRRLNGWLASQPIGTVADLGGGWTMTRVEPPSKYEARPNAPVKMPKGWILMSSGPGYSTWETTDRVHKIKTKKASNSWWGAHWSWNPNTRKHERVNTSPRKWTYAEIVEWAQQEARGITSKARRNDAKSARVLARHRHGAGYAPATIRRAGQGLARSRWGPRQMGLALGNPPVNAIAIGETVALTEGRHPANRGVVVGYDRDKRGDALYLVAPFNRVTGERMEVHPFSPGHVVAWVSRPSPWQPFEPRKNPPEFEAGDRVMVPKFGSEGRRIVRVGMQRATVLGPYLASPPGWPPHLIVEIEDGSTLTVQAGQVERQARQNPALPVAVGAALGYAARGASGATPEQIKEAAKGDPGSFRWTPEQAAILNAAGRLGAVYGEASIVRNAQEIADATGYTVQELSEMTRDEVDDLVDGAEPNPPIKRARRNPGRTLRGGAARIKR